MSLKEEVAGLVSATLGVKESELKEGVNLYQSIGVDSTEIVELIIALNKHFGVKIETNEVTKFSTPEEITGVVAKKRQG